MTTRTLLKTLALTAALGLSVTACGSNSGSSSNGTAAPVLVTAGTLTVCSDVPYAPFEDFDTSSPTGFKGFDVDIVSKIAAGLKLKLVIKKSAFDPLQSGLTLNSGQCDLAASAMTITADRAKHIAFSDGYYDSEQSLLVPVGSSIKTIADLNGKRVGVQQGTTGKTYAQEHAKGAKIVSFPSDAEMYAAIKAGQVDALLQDLPVNLAHATGGKFTLVEKYNTGEKYGFAMKKTNLSLVAAVNKQLQALRSSGDYQTLFNKYFSTN